MKLLVLLLSSAFLIYPAIGAWNTAGAQISAENSFIKEQVSLGVDRSRISCDRGSCIVKDN